MSFVWKRPEGRLKSPEQVARELLELAREMGLDEFAAVLATMCVAQESDFWCPWNRADDSSQKYTFDSESNDGRSVGYFQQQNGRAGEVLPEGDRDNWWGPMSSRMDLKQSARKFYERLEKNYHEALNDPGMASNRFISNVQRPNPSLRGEYAKHWDHAWQLVRGTALPPPPPTASYGLPTGSNSGGYGGNGVKFPDWVYALGNAFGVKPSTYPGHQETDRIEAGYARNPQHLNRAIDWAAPGDPDEINKLTRFADYLATIPQFLEQVIWQNPITGRSIEVAGGRHQPGYFADDLPNHQDHVHTRQSAPIPIPGGAPTPSPGPVELRPDFNEYPMWSPSKSSRGGAKVDLFLLHTQEGDGNADSLARFLGNPANEVSYHYTISQASDGGVTVVDVVDTNSYSWSVLSANRRSINLCFAGSRASWNREQWLRQSRAIDVTAYLAVKDCKKFGIPTRVLAPPYRSDPPGISDHKYVTEWLKDGTHTDVGPNFPWDVFTAAVNKYATPTTGDDMALVPQAEWARALAMIARCEQELTQMHPSRSTLREPREGLVDTWAGMDLNTDGNVDFLATERRARLGHPGAIARLQRVAAGGEAGRSPDDADLATAILAELDEPLEPVSGPRHATIDTDPVENTRMLVTVNTQLSGQVKQLEAEVEMLRAALQHATTTPSSLLPATRDAEQTTGQVIGNAYDALQQLRLADALPIEDRAPLAALIAVLQTKNGSEIK